MVEALLGTRWNSQALPPYGKETERERRSIANVPMDMYTTRVSRIPFPPLASLCSLDSHVLVTSPSVSAVAESHGICIIFNATLSYCGRLSLKVVADWSGEESLAHSLS